MQNQDLWLRPTGDGDWGYNAFVKESLIPFMESADRILESMWFKYEKGIYLGETSKLERIDSPRTCS